MGNHISSRVVDLNTVIGEVGKLLQSVIGEKFVLRTTLDPKLGRIKADPRKIDWLLLNLAMHAQQGLPAEGELAITTANLELAETRAIEMGVAPGPYAQIEFIAGCKMHAEAKVHEIVQQERGAISVRSVSRMDTTVTILLPRLTEAVPVQPWVAVRGSEAAAVILVVDNGASTRTEIRTLLESAGYQVLEAAHGKEAVSALAACRVDLMITDIVMPEQDGYETIKWVRKECPDLKIIAVSGARDAVHLRAAKLMGAHEAMSKPLTADVLLTAVRKQLE